MKFQRKNAKNNKLPDYIFYILTEREVESHEILKKYEGKWLQRTKKAQKFEGMAGNKLSLPSPENTLQYHLFIVDKKTNFLNIGGDIINLAKNAYAETIEINGLSDQISDLSEIIQGIKLGAYKFDKYKKNDRPLPKSIIISTSLSDNNLAKIVDDVEKVTSGIILARDLVNTPGEDMKPIDLKKTAESIAKGSGGKIKLKAFNRKDCEKMKMGSFLAVAQGSIAEPYFLHLTYKPKKINRNTARIAVIGKGVTFDTGGLSLKPADYMMTMKCDMAGAASVLGLFEILKKSDLNIEVHGIIAATDNVPSATAIKPGDVVTASNGTTIEILNTDAEGRLTLADAIVYTQKQGVKNIVDLATLTGACVVALGEEIAALYSNDQEFAKEIESASNLAHEDIWQMPLHSAYDKLLDSPIADVKNISSSRYGGSITAALFLKRFIEDDTKWAHIDIAGPAFAERKMNSINEYGATGFGVATLYELIKNKK
jgi:leucyl aminopeptidase